MNASDPGHQAAPHESSPAVRAWRAFADWRRARPFWGGLWTILAAGELLLPTMAPIEVRFIQGIAGVGTMVLSLILVAMALISWSHPHLRPITGVMIVIAGLASFVVSNLGGYFLGLLLAVAGGALIFAWRPPGGDAGTPQAATSDTAAAPGDADTPPDADESARAEASARPAIIRRRLLLVSLACLSVAATLITLPGPAGATAADPVPWPSWWPTGEPSTPDEPEDPGDPGEPGDSGSESPATGTGAKCRPDDLPATAPPMGSDAAAEAARNLAACLASRDGSADRQQRDLPAVASPPPVTECDIMTMDGLEYGGVVTVSTADGPVDTLEFTMDKLDMENMDQSAGIDGTDARLHVINMGSAARLRGDVRLYVQRIEGKIFGVVPVTMTPDTPPPLMVESLVVTDVTTETAYVGADSVALPDLEEPAR